MQLHPDLTRERAKSSFYNIDACSVVTFDYGDTWPGETQELSESMQICQSTSQLVAGSNSVADPLKSAEGLLAQRLARYRLILTEDLSNIIQSSAFVFFFCKQMFSAQEK